jgi:acyl-coenzyme A thioesterase 13
VPVALCDLALCRNASAHAEPPTPLVTVSLTTEFIAPIRAGEWLETRTTVQRAGRRLAFAQAVVYADAHPVVQASGVFAIAR